MHLNELIHKHDFEEILYILRRHPVTFIPTIFLFSILLLLPFGVGFILEAANPDIFTENFSRALTILGTSFYFLATLVFFYARFVDYYLDMWIITNHRVIDIKQTGLFARTISEVELRKIQDVQSDVRGVFATFFNYGMVEIQSAGAEVHFNFHDVPDPHRLRRELIELIRKDSAWHAAHPNE